jgi:flagellar protein FliS
MTFDPRNVYREAAAQGENPVRLVVLLYEQIIADLRNARAALAAGDIERRTAEISHALRVLGQLQASLDMDRGGDVARALDRFYVIVRGRLLEAQLRASAQILDEQMQLLLSLREAWVEVEKAGSRAVSPAQVAGASPAEWRT